MIVVDANVMLRLLEPGHPHCQASIEAIAHLTTNAAETFCTLPHCLYEVYHVLTREKNGHGKMPGQAVGELTELLSIFPPQSDERHVLTTWLTLVARHNVAGRLAYDAKIVASMVDHRLPTLLSFNDADFRCFAEITALNAFDVIGRPRV